MHNPYSSCAHEKKARKRDAVVIRSAIQAFKAKGNRKLKAKVKPKLFMGEEGHLFHLYHLCPSEVNFLSLSVRTGSEIKYVQWEQRKNLNHIFSRKSKRVRADIFFSSLSVSICFIVPEHPYFLVVQHEIGETAAVLKPTTATKK